MNSLTFHRQIQATAADWICNDKTDIDLSLFDMINIAKCAAARGYDIAGRDSDRFLGEYNTVRCWTGKGHESIW